MFSYRAVTASLLLITAGLWRPAPGLELEERPADRVEHQRMFHAVSQTPQEMAAQGQSAHERGEHDDLRHGGRTDEKREILGPEDLVYKAGGSGEKETKIKRRSAERRLRHDELYTLGEIGRSRLPKSLSTPGGAALSDMSKS